jgi:D-alanyl-lipoteichoic acid acyltransferase DltB (MBOAT superfamily)
LFKPFVINRRDWGKWAVVLGLLLTFSISGLWHGAAWTFIIWGFIHGLAMIFEFLTKKWRSKVAKKVPPLLYDRSSQVITFGFLLFTWAFFRATSLGDARYICVSMLKMPLLTNWKLLKNMVSDPTFIFGISLVILLMIYSGTRLKDALSVNLNSQPAYVRWCYYYGISLAILILGVFDHQQFIYFQF